MDNDQRALLVMSPSGVVTHSLPARGVVAIGRGIDCEIQIDDVKASRRHALVHIDDPCAIEDLGSMNGTTLGERRLTPSERTPLVAGDHVRIGSTVLVLQITAAPPTRVWSRDAFFARVDAERARADTVGYAIVRIDLEEWTKVNASRSTIGSTALRSEAARAERIEQVLRESLRPADVIGSTAPSRYEILLGATAPNAADAIAAQLLRHMREAGVGCAMSVACFPRDGGTPDGHAVHDEPPSEALAVGSSFERRLSPLVERVAAGEINVILLGETGVGKEVLARTVHARSPRAEKAFVAINCAALSETLLESELFGHEKGAFTGAVGAKQGLLESADGGTVFLDEVGEMPLALQAKLLRVLEQREVLRVGSLRPRAIDVRFLAATNRDLEAEIVAGRFRQDLYFRLNGVAIIIPPLRERVDEIESLARAFVAQACERARRAPLKIATEVVDLLRRYAWPGNIRELRNVMERAVLLTSGGVISLESFPANMLSGPLRAFGAQAAVPREPTIPAPPPIVLPEGDERARIIAALAACDGNQTHAAKLLGVSRRTLITRIEEYDLPRPRKKSD